MDTRTGDIYDIEKNQPLVDELRRLGFAKDVDSKYLALRKQEELLATGHTKVGRNELCPCGSGKKFKKCCLTK